MDEIDRQLHMFAKAPVPDGLDAGGADVLRRIAHHRAVAPTRLTLPAGGLTVALACIAGLGGAVLPAMQATAAAPDAFAADYALAPSTLLTGGR